VERHVAPGAGMGWRCGSAGAGAARAPGQREDRPPILPDGTGIAAPARCTGHGSHRGRHRYHAPVTEIELLRGVELFSELSEDELDRIIDRASHRDLERGDVI